LGIIDVKNAKHLGAISYITNHDSNAVSEVMVFDKVNPWAKLLELNSTHPLTGNRMSRLSEMCKMSGQSFPYDIDAAIVRLQVDNSKLYEGFSSGLIVISLPYIFALVSLFILPVIFVPAAFGLGLLLQIPYKFPGGTPTETNVLDQMRNPYASPVRGNLVAFSGQVVGRGVPGFILGEDMMYQDSTGLIFLDYSSSFGFIGNLFFAIGKIKTLFSIPSRAVGWFHRSMGSSVSLQYVQTEKETVKSHPALWSIVVALTLICISFYLHFR
jgi:hypothetical protein